MSTFPEHPPFDTCGPTIAPPRPWISTRFQLPAEGRVVETKIDDGHGRNEQPLKRQGRLWFFPDGSMYVYYTPTHWRPC